MDDGHEKKRWRNALLHASSPKSRFSSGNVSDIFNGKGVDGGRKTSRSYSLIKQLEDTSSGFINWELNHCYYSSTIIYCLKVAFSSSRMLIRVGNGLHTHRHVAGFWNPVTLEVETLGCGFTSLSNLFHFFLSFLVPPSTVYTSYCNYFSRAFQRLK